jgi:hypothetical protein
MRRFLIKILLHVALPVILMLGTFFFVLQISRWQNFGILNFQLAKLVQHKKKHFQTIFIGDSSCGNAIKTDNNNSINLSLTGSYGFEGTSAFLDVIDQYITYDTIVVIHTIDISTRDVSDDAIWLPYIHSSDILKKCIAVRQALPFFQKIVRHAIEKRFYISGPFNTSDDYLLTSGKTKQTENKFEAKINPKKIAELKKLDEKLAAKKKPYFLFYGPTLPYDTNYLAALNKTLKENKIRHSFNRPFVLDAVTVGNTEDHVDHNYVHLSTEYYSNMTHPKRSTITAYNNL